MAWERRKNRRYYYRSIRDGPQVKRLYFGAGAAGQRAAWEDICRRLEQDYQAWQRHQEEENVQDAAAPLDALIEATDLLARASLLAAGYHQHNHGEWRLKKHVRNANPQD
jgi:hypothetical protein